MRYKHTQIGYLMLVMAAIVGILFSFILFEINDELESISFLVLFMLIIIGILLSFVSLTVSVDEQYINIKFGYGLIRKRFNLADIASVEKVRNKWYYGWGIRIWLFPKMVIFNVSGFEAVELRMKNGSIFRIGTDEPARLKNAINQIKQ